MVKKVSRNVIGYFFIGVLTIILLWILIQTYLKLSMERRINSGEELIIRQPIYHAHADFKIFLNGREINFTNPKFDVANRYVHFHLRNLEGDKLIHIEGMENTTIGLFLDSLRMKFNSSCFILDDGKSFCNNINHRLRFFVNGKENFQFDFYEFRDLDRILITYGNQTDQEIMQQIQNVTAYACIFSNKCPGRAVELPASGNQLIF